jgi:hypothetical protein
LPAWRATSKMTPVKVMAGGSPRNERLSPELGGLDR